MVADAKGADFSAVWERTRAERGRVLEWLDVKLNRAGRAPCPVHRGEHDNFAALPNGFRCHVCGASGDYVALVWQLRHGGLPEQEGRVAALRDLANFFGITLGAPPAPTEPRAATLARELRALASLGCVLSPPAAIYESVATAFPELRTPVEWADCRATLADSWLACELERAGLWKRDAVTLPAERPSRVLLRRDAAGAVVGLRFLPLAVVADAA